MKYLKYTLLFIVLTWSISFIALYLINHGKMQMDRIFIYSNDSSTLLIWDLNRVQILWFLYVHNYEFSSYLSWVTHNESISFMSLSEDIEPNSNLLSFSQVKNHETAQSKFNIQYQIDTSNVLNIDSSELNAYFVTKTDPKYFRYMSSGTWVIRIWNTTKNAHILSDTIIASDNSYAHLKPWTEVLGFMWWFWNSIWDTYYFDISKIIRKWIWENYTDHSYLLHNNWIISDKKYGLSIDESGPDFMLLYEHSEILKVNKNNIIKLGQRYKQDTYYYFTGKKWDGTLVGWFLNFVK